MKSLYDFQSILYLILYVGFIAYQWLYGYSHLCYAALLFFAVGIQVVHHNHVHLGIWKHRKLNRLTSYFISIISAIPHAMMIGGHVKNHHVHHHGPEDLTRTYRFGGDHNHLPGYLLHPFQAFGVLIPKFWGDFWDGIPRRSPFSIRLLTETLLILACWIVLAFLDWHKLILFVLIPQAFGLHWLLGANYLQHAHCDDESKFNFARNFTGPINLIWFNIGFHTAHHDHPKAHWSTLRKIHEAEIQGKIDPKLCCNSFPGYVAKTYFLSPFIGSFRSESLRKPSSVEPSSV